MLLKAKGGEVDTLSEDFRFGENRHTTDAVNLHFHIGVAIGVAEVGQMRAPGSILCVSFHNDSVLVKGVGEREGGFGFLP